MDSKPGKRRPEGSGALDSLGRALEAAQGDALGPGSVNIATADLRTLGGYLRRVAAGEDARHVFAQTREGYNVFQRQRKSTIAYLYWRTLAEQLDAGARDRSAKAEAIACARRQFPRQPIEPDTVRSYAEKLREPTLAMLRSLHRQGQGCSLAALDKYLAKHTHEGAWSD